MPYWERAGGRLFYERGGEGRPPLIFVHGNGCTHEDWDPQVEFFRPRHDVVACDLRGHGASARAPGPYDIETDRRERGRPFIDPFLPVVVLANHLRLGPGLKAGQVAATGSFTGFFEVEPDRPVTAEFVGFGTAEAIIVSTGGPG